MLLLHFFLFISSLTACSHGFNILGFFPFPGRSHHNLFAPVMRALAEKGHDVVYYTPILATPTQPRLKQVLIKDFGPHVLGTIDFKQLGNLDSLGHMRLIYSKMLTLLELVYQEPEVKELLKSNEKFDAVILESYFFQEANSALIHKFGAVGIDIMPLGDNVWINEITGIKTHYSYMTDYKTELTDELTLMDRYYNTILSWTLILNGYWYLYHMESLMNSHLQYDGWNKRPPLSTMLSNRSLVIVNKDPFIGFSYPHSPHVKEIGGLNIIKPPPLSLDLKRFMDNSNKGFVYMALGLNMQVSGVLKYKLQNFFDAFAGLEQNVLLKWEVKPDVNIPPNVKVLIEFPQQSVLAHPNCKLFITHGGYFSLTETIYHGVPIIGIPFYGDQPRNILWAEKAGVGVKLSPEWNITKRSIKWALQEVLFNPRYKEEMAKRSQMVRSRKLSPMEDAIYWIEHAIKYPNILTPKSALQSYIVFHQLDVEVILLLKFGTIFFCPILCMYFLWKGRRSCKSNNYSDYDTKPKNG